MAQKLLIENLSQLVDALHACALGIFEYTDVMESAAINPEELAFAIQWDSEQYTRTILEKNDDFELLLLCWEPHQESPIHDHNGQKGWMRMIEGELTEVAYQIGSDAVPMIVSRHVFNTPDCSHISKANGIHKIINTSDAGSISLHLYVKPIDMATIYEETGETSILNL